MKLPLTFWAGRIMSALPTLFLLVDSAMKLVKPEPVVKATIAFPILLGALLWGGLVLRNDRLRNVMPLVRSGADGCADSSPATP